MIELELSQEDRNGDEQNLLSDQMECKFHDESGVKSIFNHFAMYIIVNVN